MKKYGCEIKKRFDWKETIAGQDSRSRDHIVWHLVAEREKTSRCQTENMEKEVYTIALRSCVVYDRKG